VQALVLAFYPGAETFTHSNFLGLSALGSFSFLFMWLFQLLIFFNGMETIRKFIDFCGPVVYIVMFALAIWILAQTGTSSLSLQLSQRVEGSAVGHMANAAMLIVAYFAALLLNFGDFSRFARSENTMKVGNFLGLPVHFIVFAIITVIVTAGTVKVFGEAIMDPVAIVERIGNPWVVALGSITFIVATMGINIVANFVSPAYDISNLYPEKIDFRPRRADRVDPVGDGVPVDLRLKPAGHHHFCQHFRRRARTDVRHHGGGLLSGEAPASHP
jgi:nucleobase:cation symporter-1, NCS1 family